MKNLELNQMEVLQGGIDYGDASCGEFWAGVSIGFGAASWYATAVLGPAGGVAMFVGSGVASLAGLAC